MESKGLIRQAEEIVVKLNIIKEDVVVAMDDENKEKVLEENSKQSEISENIVGEKNCCVAPTKTSAKVVAPVKEEPKEIDESELVVGIDLKQEETKE
jgi:aconitase B